MNWDLPVVVVVLLELEETQMVVFVLIPFLHRIFYLSPWDNVIQFNQTDNLVTIDINILKLMVKSISHIQLTATYPLIIVGVSDLETMLQVSIVELRLNLLVCKFVDIK